MQTIGVVILIILLLFIGAHYGLMVVENKKLKEESEEDAPVKQIFIYNSGTESAVQELIKISVSSHLKAEAQVVSNVSDTENGSLQIDFDIIVKP